MRIIFMGSPEFSVPTLEALIDSPHDIIAVYTQPPRPAARGKAPRPTAVHTRALEANLPVHTPLNFKNPDDIETFRAHKADLAIVIAYGLILPQSILDAPIQGALNLHASLLPRWRGAAPIHRAIMAGDKETGTCLMQMTAGLDQGPVLARTTTPITADTTTGDLHDILAELSAQLLMDNLPKLADLTPIPQPDQGITYAEKISKSEAEINWALPASHIRAQIHGLSPFPGAWSMFEGERIKFHRVELAEGQGQPGQILDQNMRIACGEGAILPLEIQRAGKRTMSAEDALRGLGDIQNKIMRSQ